MAETLQYGVNVYWNEEYQLYNVSVYYSLPPDDGKGYRLQNESVNLGVWMNQETLTMLVHSIKTAQEKRASLSIAKASYVAVTEDNGE